MFVRSLLLGGDGSLAAPSPRVVTNSFRVDYGGVDLLAPSRCGYARSPCHSSAQWWASYIYDASGLAATANVVLYGSMYDEEGLGGIVLEEGRTNLVLSGRDVSAASWTLFGTATRTIGQASMFLDNNAYRIQASSGTNGIGEATPSATASAFTTSGWIKSISGTAAPNFNTFRSVAGRVATNRTVGTAWERFTQTLSGGGGETSTVVPVDGRDWSGVGGVVAGARDFAIDALQRELGNFPTEFIPTAGATRTRNPTYLWLLAEQVTPAVSTGRFSIELRFRPKGARNEYAADMALWWIDANNKALVNPTTGLLTITVAGVTNTTTLPLWARYDTVDVFIACGGGLATVVAYSINSAAAVRPAITGSALGTVPAGDCYLWSTNTTGNHLSCWGYEANTYRPGFLPTWAF